MIINKQFDELKQIFNDAQQTENLIAKKYLVNLKKKKIENIKIEGNSINCTYSPDNKYSYKLKFVKTGEGLIEFSVKIPSLVYLVVVGGLIGSRFIDEVGIIGIILGIGLFFVISLVFKSFVKNGIKNRIIKNWDEVNSK
jgi:hypothetical protein